MLQRIESAEDGARILIIMQNSSEWSILGNAATKRTDAFGLVGRALAHLNATEGNS